MKRLIVAFVCLVFIGYVFAEPEVDKADKKPEEKSLCPVTKISENSRCSDCHVLVRDGDKVKYGLKEINYHDQFGYPNRCFKFIEQDGKRVGHLLLTSIDASIIEDTFDYLSRHTEIKKLIIELHNPGGSMFGMWRIVSLMDGWKAKGNIIETECRGFSASASFVVFANGSKGYRFVAPESLHMWHEAMSFSMFNISTASSTEDEAKIMRKFQDTAHNWLASKSKVSKDKLDQLVSKKEYWLTGKEMVELGFADGFLK